MIGEVHTFSTNLTPIFVYFTQLPWLIATFFTVTACSMGGRVSWTIRSIWIRSVVLLKYVKGFPSLCCGYFKTCSTIGYRSRLIILSTSNSGANVEREEEWMCWKRLILLFFCCGCFAIGHVKPIQWCVKCYLSCQEQSVLLEKVK